MHPRATYRIQFHRGFTFADAADLAPYLSDLGISHLYASPILSARAGSSHGYDVVDHSRVNPELGGEEGFRALVASFQAKGMGIILDIVPNHMAVGGADNPYWLDLLEKGRESVFANLFDIDWEPAQPSLRDKVLVPFLGKPLHAALDAGDISLVWDPTLGKYAFAYAEHRFPLRREDYPQILGPGEIDLTRFNDPRILADLLSRQNFRLADWRDAGQRINWRRFFDVTGLAALRMEDPAVFELVHGTIFRFYSDGLIDGVRIDHVDGLADPRAYCRRLRARLEALLPQRQNKEPPYIVVEKILAPGECLPGDWEVAGTTGYDFMNQVSALQHDGANSERFGRLWASISGRSQDFETEECMARRETLAGAFGNALRAAATAFRALFLDCPVTQTSFEQALSLLLENLRAYRTYATGDSPEPPAGKFFEDAYAIAKQHADADTSSALEMIAGTMRGEQAILDAGARDAARRFNQLAAPIAAKAVEDTAFYRYGRLLSRNDVGFSPACFALSGQDFLSGMGIRPNTVPQGLLATATHDHKHGEDMRARLAALSEIPELWEHEVTEWFALNAPLRTTEIEPGEEYQLYQTLLGCWPLDLHLRDERALDAFAQRILAWRQKSLRESKLRTSWTSPNPAIEMANSEFISAILNPRRSAVFLEKLASFVRRLAPAGIFNSLVQCVLHYTYPGVPDLYQGTELWDFSLVDPDNRRPVDFNARQQALAAPLVLADDWQHGRIKLALIKQLLASRASAPECFLAGDFRAIEVRESRSGQIVAFSRQAADTSILVAVPRLCAIACMTRGFPLPPADFWTGCAFSLPKDVSERAWYNALAPDRNRVVAFDCASLFAVFPAAVLISTAA